MCYQCLFKKCVPVWWFCQRTREGWLACSCLGWPFGVFEDDYNICCSLVVQDFPSSPQPFSNDSSVARALASSLYSLMQPFRACGQGQVLWSNPLILTHCCSFSSLIPFIMYRGLGDFGEDWSKENMEHVSIICVCCHCMLTPFGSRPTLCFFSLLLMMQVEEALVALDISCSCCLVGLWLSWQSLYCPGSVSKFFRGRVSTSYCFSFCS